MASIAAPGFPTPAHCTSSHSVASATAPSSLRSTTAFLAPSYRHAPLSGFRRLPPGAAEPFLCRCQNPSSDAGGTAPRRWDEVLQDAVKSAAKRWDDYLRSVRGSLEKVAAGASVEQRDMAAPMEDDGGDGDWSWERWKRHFVEVEEHEKIVSVLRSQLNDAVYREDYKDAAKLKRAIAAAAANDAVGCAIKNLNNAVRQEHYEDAIFLRDNAGTGLVGWWAGISDDSSDPYGRVIRITAEHGKYVARSYSSRQLANGRSGFPLFEVYFTIGNDGGYKQQAVYLKRKADNPRDSEKAPAHDRIDSTGPISDSEDTAEISVIEDLDIGEGADDSDASDGLDGVQNILHDMIPGVKVKVLKVISPGIVDQDLISNIIEQIMDEEEGEDEDSEVESTSDNEENEDEDDVDEIEIEVVESEDGIEMELESEEIELGTEDMIPDITNEHGGLSLKFVVGGIVENLSVDLPPKDLVRVPARLEKKGRFSFSFSPVQDNKQHDLEGKERMTSAKTTKHPNLRSPELIMADLAKVLASKEKIPIKILKDVGEMIKLTLNRDRNNQPLCGTMFFNRIEMTANSDPLSGLYISAHGMFNTEVLKLRRKFGQWKEDGKNQKNTKLEFYEYVEALKLTGDPSVPAGQVAFRAKVGTQYQLPHKGIIPDEFGVIARYKGQGRLAEPGFRNPRWVDGELVILDGKYIRGGPVIGFVYWAPEYHYLMFFNRLKLPE